jgi:Holliday junction resolvasome RuvABC DNA-binding subunit
MAKKIVLELKDSVQIFEAIQVDQDQKLFKSVTKSLQNFGFESSRVKELLRNYPEKLTEENLPNVVKWVISEM